MNLVVNKIDTAFGKISVPGDKSISHRSIMLGSIANGRTYVEDLLFSEDVTSTIECFKKLGVSIYNKDNITIIEGLGINHFKKYEGYLDSNNSGTTVRLMMGLLSGSENRYSFIGDDTLRKRPMNRITEPLESMGADVKFLEKFNNLPISIKGGYLKAIDYKLPVASAQVKSAIILAGLNAEGLTTIEEPEITRDHTEIMIRHFAGNISKRDNIIRVEGGQNLMANKVIVPGDISSAAFFIVLGLIVNRAEIMISNVGLNPTRTGIIDVLEAMGGKFELVEKNTDTEESCGTILIRSSELKGITIEGSIIPRLIDEIPIIAVAATQAHGITVIKDAGELKVKESNRIKMIVDNLRKMGANIEETDDGMVIKGPTKLKGAIINSAGDHRIAMAFTIAGLIAEDETNILDSECMDVSFPNFIKLLRDIVN